ncbi:lysozyme inhibitor LprI family protein [Aeromonas jandaei]|uniref:lysozyme inhibitor LprI family protein n=1 Tax=Aeromonas jandaei TaxID=650 RepID=UPI0039860350
MITHICRGYEPTAQIAEACFHKGLPQHHNLATNQHLNLFLKPQYGVEMSRNKSIINLFVAASFIISPYLSHAASFDCKKAKTSNEKLICMTPELSQLDEELAKIYLLSLKNSADNDIIKKSQRAWLKQIKKECSSADCLIKNYRIRLETLKNWEKSIPADTTMLGTHYLSHSVPIISNSTKDGYYFIDAKNCISIEEKDNKTISFSILTFNTNGHICDINGIAKLVGNEYQYIPSSDTDGLDNTCSLRIVNRAGSILILDPEMKCREFSCGMRAGLDGTVFPKNLSMTTGCDRGY